MKILAAFYMTTSFLDWIFHHYSIKEIENGHLTCTNSIYVTVADSQGAWFMLLDTLVQYLYTFTIIIVFYEVPKRVYGQYSKVKTNNGSMLDMEKGRKLLSLDTTMADQEDQAKQLFSAMQAEENFMASQVAARKNSLDSNGDESDHGSPRHRKLSAAWLNSAECEDDSRINTTEDGGNE